MKARLDCLRHPLQLVIALLPISLSTGQTQEVKQPSTLSTKNSTAQFFAEVQSLAEKTRTLILADGFPEARKPFHIEDKNSKVLLSEWGEQFDFTLTRPNAQVALFSRRFYQPKEIPQINLQEWKSAVKVALETYSTLSVDTKMLRFGFNKWYQVLTPEQKEHLKAKQPITTAELLPAQREMLWKKLLAETFGSQLLVWRDLDGLLNALPESKIKIYRKLEADKPPQYQLVLSWKVNGYFPQTLLGQVQLPAEKTPETFPQTEGSMLSKMGAKQETPSQLPSLKRVLSLRASFVRLDTLGKELSRQTGYPLFVAPHLRERRVLISGKAAGKAILDGLQTLLDVSWYQSSDGSISLVAARREKPDGLAQMNQAVSQALPLDWRRFLGIGLSDKQVRARGQVTMPEDTKGLILAHEPKNQVLAYTNLLKTQAASALNAQYLVSSFANEQAERTIDYSALSALQKQWLVNLVILNNPLDSALIQGELPTYVSRFSTVTVRLADASRHRGSEYYKETQSGYMLEVSSTSPFDPVNMIIGSEITNP